MTAPIRSLTALPLDDHACRDCDGRGFNVDPSAHDYAPGAWRRVPCATCRPHVADTAPRVSSAQLLDAARDEWAARDPEGYDAYLSAREAYFYSLAVAAAVVSGITWIAADLLFRAAVGVV